MKRIFLAIDLSNEARRQAAEYISDLRTEFPDVRAGWDKSVKLHITLKFLGDVDEIQLHDLSEAVRKTAKQISEFRIRISQTGAFPSKKKARVLWLGIEDEKGSLYKLNEMLETECRRKGFPAEQRSFKAHLTVARLREPQKSKQLVEKHLENDFESDEFTVSEIVIYESRLAPTGSVYSVIEKEKFAQ